MAASIAARSPSSKRRRRRLGTCGDGRLSSARRKTECCGHIHGSARDSRSSGRPHKQITASVARRRLATRTGRSLAAGAKAIAACGWLLGSGSSGRSAGLIPTVLGFSAICSPPRPGAQQAPGQKQQQQQPQSRPAAASTPQARRFLEDIITHQRPNDSISSTSSSCDGRMGEEGPAFVQDDHDVEKLQQEHLEEVELVEMTLNEQEGIAAAMQSMGFGGWGLAAAAAVAATEDALGPSSDVLDSSIPGPPTEAAKADATREGPGIMTRVGRRRDSHGMLTPRKDRPKYGYAPARDKRTREMQGRCAELCREKLLTREEEYELGTKIQALMSYMAVRDRLAVRIGRQPTAAEWAESCFLTVSELQESIDVCRDAKHVMVRANMRMVVSIARKYSNLGVSLNDLIQEGSLGLIRAVEKFDPERGFKLSTYAAWWIQQAVFKGIAQQNRVIRLPMHVHNLLQSIRKAKHDLAANDGREPTDLQVAQHLKIPVKRLKKYLKITKEAISFEVPTCSPEVSSKNQRLLGDTLTNRDGKVPEKMSEAQLVRAKLREMVQELPDDEKTIVTLRYGLDNGKPKTLGQIADIVHTTTPYVRRVETIAMRKLRHPEQQGRLRELSVLLHATVPVGELFASK